MPYLNTVASRGDLRSPQVITSYTLTSAEYGLAKTVAIASEITGNVEVIYDHVKLHFIY